MKIKNISLGRCLVDMSFLSPQCQVRQKRRLKPNPVISGKQRISELRSFIELMGNVTRYAIKNHFVWGCGIMERVHRDLMSMYSDEISWNPKKQTYYWIENPKIKGMLV